MKAPLRETLWYVAGQVGPGSADVLEVGAGDGALALELQRMGHRVTALDASNDAVEAALRRGVTAVQAEWPDFDGCCFDHVLFTRSLHHVHELGAAVQKALDVLRPGGSVVVEDFAFHEADAATAGWLAERAREAGAGESDGCADAFAGRMARSGDPLRDWSESPHHIHPWRAMRAAFAERTEILGEETAPYLYRYLECAGDEALDDALAREVEAAGRGEIRWIGRRLVAG